MNNLKRFSMDWEMGYEYPDKEGDYVLAEKAIATITEQAAEIKTLEWAADGRGRKELEATITELTKERDDYFRMLNMAGQTTGLRLLDAEATITELTAEKEALEDMMQSAIDREIANERQIDQLETKLKKSLRECDFCGAALKQETKHKHNFQYINDIATCTICGKEEPHIGALKEKRADE